LGLKTVWLLLESASELVFDVFEPLAGDVTVRGEVEGEVSPEVLGGFGEAVCFGEERGDGEVRAAVGAAGFFEEADSFRFVLVLAGQGNAEEVEAFRREGVCLDGPAGEGFGRSGAIGTEMDEGEVRQNRVGGGIEFIGLREVGFGGGEVARENVGAGEIVPGFEIGGVALEGALIVANGGVEVAGGFGVFGVRDWRCGSSEEYAHNGLASARQDGRVPRPLVPSLRGLCAF
jgi:hypothetical protein